MKLVRVAILYSHPTVAPDVIVTVLALRFTKRIREKCPSLSNKSPVTLYQCVPAVCSYNTSASTFVAFKQPSDGAIRASSHDAANSIAASRVVTPM